VKASALTAKPAQPKVPRPTIAAPAAKLLAGPSVTGAAPNHSALGAGVSPGGSTMDTGANALTPEQARARATAKVQQLHTRNFSGTAPARILWQVQPGVPSWANKLEIEQSVVKLDAVIDENGNLAQTRVLSGPRALQHSAQQAVGLWIFAPAQADGKPASSHMILTVEFQR
jgi:outer membrane biosynthesis protein TonB